MTYPWTPPRKNAPAVDAGTEPAATGTDGHPARHHGPSADHTIPEGPALRRVILESPYAAPDQIGIKANVDYARRAMRDLMRGEAPLASHLLYTQPGILDDGHPDERRLGIEAGLTWLPAAEATVVYADRGITPGMQQGIDRARAAGRPVEMRIIDEETP